MLVLSNCELKCPTISNEILDRAELKPAHLKVSESTLFGFRLEFEIISSLAIVYQQ